MDRSQLLNDVSEHDGTNYAEPLAGLRVSWGSILAGALGILCVSGIIFALAVAIILTATGASLGSLEGSLIAIWICAMATTLIGGFVGGWIAGYMPGNKNRLLGAAHAFLAWGLAFVLMTGIYFSTLGAFTRTVLDVGTTAASATVQTAGSAVGGVAGGSMSLDSKATNLLESLGYTPAQARSMVTSAQGQIQRALHGKAGAPATPSASAIVGPVINWGAGLAWSWWGTWFVTAALSVLGGLLSVRQLSPGRRRREVEPRAVPVTPAPEPAE